MFARNVCLRLKPNTLSEFTRIATANAAATRSTTSCSTQFGYLVHKGSAVHPLLWFSSMGLQ